MAATEQGTGGKDVGERTGKEDVRCPLIPDRQPLKTEVSSKKRTGYKERGIKVRKRPKQASFTRIGSNIELRI